MTQVVAFDNADTFLEQAGDFLSSAPRRNTVNLSVAEAIRQAASRDTRFLVIKHNGRAIAAALQSPAFRLFSSAGQSSGLPALAKWLHDEQANLPGVVGSEALSTAFNAIWSDLTGLSAHKAKSLRLYSLEALLRWPAPPAGRARKAIAEESPLL